MRRKAMLVLVAIAATLVVGSGVALAATFTCSTTNPCEGTSDNDVITGTSGFNVIVAKEGNDLVNALGDDDEVYGGPDGDGSVNGTALDDLNLEGAAGSDTVYGQGGNDVIDADTNDTSGSFDRSYGGGHDDRIYADDGNEDFVNCGRGRDDVARIDQRIDTAKSCETVRRD